MYDCVDPYLTKKQDWISTMQNNNKDSYLDETKNGI